MFLRKMQMSILMLQNCQILAKEPNSMSSSPASFLSDGEYLYYYESYKRRVHEKIDAVFYFITDISEI